MKNRNEGMEMPEVFVSRIDDFAEGDRRIVFHGGLEIGVFHWEGSSTPTPTCACTRAGPPAKA